MQISWLTNYLILIRKSTLILRYLLGFYFHLKMRSHYFAHFSRHKENFCHSMTHKQLPLGLDVIAQMKSFPFQSVISCGGNCHLIT
jgi:hypothetical protein